MNKPIIGITTFCKKENKFNKSYNKVSYNYISSVIKAGGVPVLIPLLEDKAEVKTYIEMIDGLILSGGDDICPNRYGEHPIAQVTKFDSKRDEWEIELFRGAYRRELPILGICRGMQLMNIALGGSLYQDIIEEYQDGVCHLSCSTDVCELYHSLQIKRNTKLFNILKREEIKVNSYHHQAVKDLGRELIVTAKSEEGIVEGIESENREFVIGVQWHPEDLTLRYSSFLELFKKLVITAEKEKR
ncbi:putative glutamine amidotransferase [Orenia metallireducens]|uniref:Putative glutamine amidotransferase n=1 Tax=Orenia metallireducens TaxID=1413210 RepID=A0A285GEZ1_9FIRM|nr:gamma-glutamyl-gamma-aminobutyrate hydrolase family protein [Orenia metallireducens]SNY22147.1 putative glutamine amidotransferase [Orenia metallireducens]